MVKVEGLYRLKKGRFEDNFLVFERDGVQCIREWTSLTGDRVKNDPAFAVTMAYANVQTLASKTSSRVYAQVTGERHVYSLFVLLKKVAYQLFKRGYSIETVYSWLREAVGEQGFWWEEWAEGVEPKVIVLEIVRQLYERRFGGITRMKGKEPAAVEEVSCGEISRRDAKKGIRKGAKGKKAVCSTLYVVSGKRRARKREEEKNKKSRMYWGVDHSPPTLAADGSVFY